MIKKSSHRVILCSIAGIMSFMLTVIHAQEFYNELYRPQYHFTAKDGWIGDPVD